MLTDEYYENRCKRGHHCLHVLHKWPGIGSKQDGPRGYEYTKQCCHCGEVFKEETYWIKDDRHGKWYNPIRDREYTWQRPKFSIFTRIRQWLGR